MANIGGNITGIFQSKTAAKRNEIGEWTQEWADVVGCVGWLGMQSNDSKYTNFSTKMEEVTDVFLCDYHSGIYALKGKDIQMLIRNEIYDVLYIDNPDEMDEQLEIYLRKIGGRNGR